MLPQGSSGEMYGAHHGARDSKASSSSHRRVSLEEAMAIKAEVDYQRLNKSFTDVTFIVGPAQHSKKYVGHRVLLAMTSPVFETMFYGDMADKNKYIRIPDVAPIGFENLLRYAYTDSLNLSAVEDAMLTAYAAKKYLLPQLLSECLTYIEHNIGPSTACVVFEFAQVLNSQQLVLQAMNLIDRQTNNVIANKSFSHVQASTVEFVANRKYLSLSSELALFNAVIGWALAEARRRQIDTDDWGSIRQLLLGENSILGAIRFLAMTQEEFARAVVKSSSAAGQEPVPTSHTNGAGATSTQASATEGGDLGAGAGVGGLDGPPPASGSSSGATTGRVDPSDPNSLLSGAEQRAIFLNLALAGASRIPPAICNSTRPRQPPPEHFTLKRFRSASSSSSGSLVTTTTSTRSIKSITSRFQCLSENVFIVALTLPIRLDVSSSYTNRTPKFECHLKFTTKSSGGGAGGAAPISGGGGGGSPLLGSGVGGGALQQPESIEAGGSATLLMDTIDESLHISIARDKDCLVRLKRPILVRMGNINELTLTFQTYALDEDIVALRTPRSRSGGQFSEQTDAENISWLFFKTSNIEFSELHYYY